MPDPTATIDIIRTKLHRPPLTPDLVPREHLLARLEANPQRALTLVSAPAGYGKSTLVSHWLERETRPSAWLSLEAADSDLRRFLQYLIAALQTLAPEIGRDTLALLKKLDLPPWKILAQTLLNELSRLKEVCLLVLDDYHRLHESAIHDLLNELLAHPLPALHLVLIARHDPPLPLSRLRAHHRLLELREPDLRFSPSEVRIFLQQASAAPVEEHSVALLDERTEGWVTGLRLFTLSLRGRSDVAELVRRLPENNQHVVNYLLEEVLVKQPEAVQACLLRTAILDRFCASLCEAICGKPGSDKGEHPGQTFVSTLMQQGLFVVAIDEQHRWFRYHHLFQRLLRYRLQTRYSP
jgi:LuxR family maltose regulon positive regulatory protein